MIWDMLAEVEKRAYPLIIAELGAKYASLDIIKQMIQRAKDCGADMVKLQTYQAETISTPGSFFTMEDSSKVPQFEFFQRYEFSRKDHEMLDEYCCDVGISWFSTPSHPNDVELLEAFDPIGYKTGSDDITNLPFLRYIAEKQRPMIVSTGICTLGEIEQAVENILSTGNDRIVLLHCVVSYPSKPEDANLRIIETLQHAFGLPVGLSDHTQDEFTSILATQLGAVIIEKHFTLDYALNLPDSHAAVDPEGLKKLVERVRLVPKALGNGVKRILETEKTWRESSRKSLFSICAIKQGQRIQEQDVTIRRPGNGIHPHHLGMIIGRQAMCDIPANTLLTWEMV